MRVESDARQQKHCIRGVFTHLNSHQTENKMSLQNHQLMFSAVLKPKKCRQCENHFFFCRERARREEGETELEGKTVKKRNNYRITHKCAKTHKWGRRERPPFSGANGADRKKSVAGNPSHLEGSAYFTATLTLKVGQTTANSLHT